MRVPILSCPKSFSGPAGELQEKSICNWTEAGATPVLAGPKADIESVPTHLNVRSESVENSVSSSSLPLFTDLLSAVDENDEVICYANCDLLFANVFSGFHRKGETLFWEDAQLPEQFLMLGSRWDLKEVNTADRTEIYGSREALAAGILDMRRRGEVALHDPDAMDFFVFPRSMFDELDPAIVGRGGYDNALVAYCLRRRIPVIDVSRDWPVLHQFHSHDHKKGGQKEVYLGEEAMKNRKTHDILQSPPNALDADFVMDGGILFASPWRGGLLRRCEVELRYRYGQKLISFFFRALQRVIGAHDSAFAKEMEETERCIERLAKQ